MKDNNFTQGEPAYAEFTRLIKNLNELKRRAQIPPNLPVAELLELCSEASLLLARYFNSEEGEVSVNPKLVSRSGLYDSNDTLVDKNFTIRYKKPKGNKDFAKLFQELGWAFIRFERAQSVETAAVLSDLGEELSFLRTREQSSRQDLLSEISRLEDRWFSDVDVIRNLKSDLEYLNAEIRELKKITRRKMRAIRAITRDNDVLKKAVGIARSLHTKRAKNTKGN